MPFWGSGGGVSTQGCTRGGQEAEGEGKLRAEPLLWFPRKEAQGRVSRPRTGEFGSLQWALEHRSHLCLSAPWPWGDWQVYGQSIRAH